ncbi:MULTISPECIES: Holliday junction resolvase RuvX [Mycobacteriaceae]|uniref:Putative pre-16S rRNA nuclease n=1 Tax=Mycolicibacterium mucogenicum DSM 44124 TaxID=1226753 RepID=A0A8H2JDF5_MYCMU|nr:MULTISPECIES: Holliday junction resolvase RuvX [Mycobacteriaceae]KAB7758343.1 Holliday junction resolvase [Mycolicibacterium mucogenicum DSM 44124]QPG71770.1 Holliday junction resolvase RuvX [Mycolicibacterium mucogenicum DSM 44124]SEB20807.1 putative holliday junction resolvase [Mycobacterium sp. 283mftsu]
MADTDRMPDRPGADDPGRGRRLGIDVGTVRIGVAVCDPDGILATPLETVRRDKTDKHLGRLVKLAGEQEAVEIVVGLPRTLKDRASSSAQDAIEVADALAVRVAPTPVRMADERLTTVTAQRSLREAGVRAKGQRQMIDQVAAVGILQNWLDMRRSVLAARERSEEADL